MEPSKCFYCSELVEREEISVFGKSEKDQEIKLHPECAKRLSDGLNKDWERFKTANPQISDHSH